MKRNTFYLSKMLLLSTVILGIAGCQTEISITPPPDVTIDLGQSLDPMEGVIVEGAKEEDVLVLWNPAFNNNLVDHYITTYAVDGVSATRNVYVRSNLLAGTYRVTDVIQGGPTLAYNVTVTQSDLHFNRILINGFADFDIIVHADIDGANITIPLQTPTGWTPNENVSGTGTYNGANRTLSTFTYQIRFLVGGNIVTETGTATFTRQ